MKQIYSYPYSIVQAVYSLCIGMHRTFSSMTHPKRILTQQYPENRTTTLYVPERFKAELKLRSDENGTKCTACTLCQIACPNDSIVIKTKVIINSEGKSKRVLDSYVHELGKCTFCGLCVDSCNFDALEMNNSFEKSEYCREKLIRVLYESKPEKVEEIK